MKIFNFAPGPSMIPKPVMERVQTDFMNYNSMGVGFVELSHRSEAFLKVITKVEDNIRELMKVGDDYSVCFIQGGASLQFAMIPMNFMKKDGFAEYADTGYWSEKAILEAKKLGDVRIICSSKESMYNKIPNVRKWKPDNDASYLHMTTNNTTFGTQFQTVPELDQNVPLIADMSTDLMTRKININQFDMVYASTQKVLGPSGMAVVLIKKDLADRADGRNLPTMLDYHTYMYERSMHNTPPTFSIYMLKLVTDWLKDQGGMKAMDKINTLKSGVIYEYLDSSDFYSNFVEPCNRSRMNIVFRTSSNEMDDLFVQESEKIGLIGLRGHRAIGGLRASIYNSMPLEGVEVLIDFMNEFERKHG
ncbi:MAG: 3-phosphoserine/phosphohydroxythreonine transaminase [bacterium]|nr:3-phosphoserine/phosphohydroxythreonine transaminase [bacterium]